MDTQSLLSEFRKLATDVPFSSGLRYNYLSIPQLKTLAIRSVKGLNPFFFRVLGCDHEWRNISNLAVDIDYVIDRRAGLD